MEALFKIWTGLTETFGPFEAALVFGAVLVLWVLYRHIFARLLNTLGEWCDRELRGKLSLPPKSPPSGE